jgi:hypothetical protein
MQGGASMLNGGILEMQIISALVAGDVRLVRVLSSPKSTKQLLACINKHAPNALKACLSHKECFLDRESARSIWDYVLSTDVLITYKGWTIACDITCNEDLRTKNKRERVKDALLSLGIDRHVILQFNVQSDISITNVWKKELPDALSKCIKEDKFFHTIQLQY